MTEHRPPLTIAGTVYDRDGGGQWYIVSDSDLLPCGPRLNAVLERLAADSKRLDWLETEAVYISIRKTGDVIASSRGAIDAAMSHADA